MQALSTKTAGEFLEKNAKNYPDKEAAVYCDEDTRYNWRQLNQLADEAAKGLLALGIKRGEHVAIWGTNRPEWLITQFAAAKIGAVLVTVNPEWKAEELEYSLSQSDSKILVMQRRLVKEGVKKTFVYDYLKILQEVAPEIKNCDPENMHLEKLPKLKSIILVSKEKEKGMLKWDALLSKGALIAATEYASVKHSVKYHDAILIQYTSGTTGFPKGAVLSHLSIVNNALACSRNTELNHKDRICSPVPYYHIFGSATFNICCLVSGATMIIPAEHFNVKKTLEAIQREKCTVIYGVPTMFIAELNESNFSSFNLSSLRTGIIAGAPCPTDLMKDIFCKMGVEKMTIAYGLSEAGPMTHQTLPNDPFEKRVSAVGKPLENTEAKIVNPSTLKETSPNEPGEIWVRGYNVMLGYYNRPEETKETIVNGWLRTGDLGIKDENGYYKIVGRLKEMFIVGGHNVYPAEVEQALRAIFKNEIEDVYVVGVPHPILQEVAAAIVKLKPAKTLMPEEIQSKCQEVFEWQKIPRHIKFVDDFSMAMTITGKIQRQKLKEIFTKELESEESAKATTT